MKMGMMRNYLFVDCGTLFLVHSSTFLFLDGRALLFLNCVVLGVANLRTGEDEENRENKGEKGDGHEDDFLLAHSQCCTPAR